MGAIDATTIYRGPGTLKSALTGGSPPSGGTVLGTVSNVTLRLRRRDLQVPYEEFGGAIGEVVRGGWIATLKVRMRQWDNNAFAVAFGTNIQEAGGFSIPDTDRAGRLGSDESTTLLYLPDDALRPAILAYKAIPWFDDEGTDLEFMVRRELGLELNFLLMHGPANSNRTLTVNALASLTL